MSIKGMQVSLKGVQLLQGGAVTKGGAVVSTAPTKLTIHSVQLVQFLLGWCTSCSGKRQSRAETSAPPEYALLLGWRT